MLRRGLATAREHGQEAVVGGTHAGRKGGRRVAIEPMQVQCHDEPQRDNLGVARSIVKDVVRAPRRGGLKRMIAFWIC